MEGEADAATGLSGRDRRARRRRFPLVVPAAYPIAFAVAYVGLLFFGIGVSVYSAARVFVVTTVGAAVVAIVCNLLMGDRDRGGLLALIVVMLLLVGTGPAAAVVLGLAAALVIAERLLSLRRPSRVRWRIVTTVANAVAVIVLLTFVVTGIEEGGFRRAARDISPIRAAVPHETTPRDPPDVYVIVLDGYERPNKMEALFGYDDGPFADALEARGFDVATESRSNYLLTTLSIPSLLNMRHVVDLIDARPTGDADYRFAINQLVSDADVVRRMRGLGYRIVAVASGFEELAMRGADEVVDTGQLNEFEVLLARETAVESALNVVAPLYLTDVTRDRTTQSLAATARLAGRPHDQPLFVFAHIPAPHGPLVFGPNGEVVRAPTLDTYYEDTAHGLGLSREMFGRRYVGEIAYLNGLALRAVDDILAVSPRPPVILVLSDHGSGSGLNWTDLAHSDLDERSANLFAAYTPGHDALFPDDITLVNVFGRLFGAYFGIEVPTQPNVLYRWDDGNTHLVVAPEVPLGD
jgi:hypothetical protein